MRLLPLLLLGLPVGMLLFGWLIGAMRIPRAFMFFFLWILMCEGLIIWSFISGDPQFVMPMLLLAITLALCGPMLAVVFSAATSRQVTPPVVIAAEVYDGLTPDQKTKVHNAARLVARFAAKHIGNRLQDKGHRRSAQALHEVGKMI